MRRYIGRFSRVMAVREHARTVGGMTMGCGVRGLCGKTDWDTGWGSAIGDRGAASPGGQHNDLGAAAMRTAQRSLFPVFGNQWVQVIHAPARCRRLPLLNSPLPQFLQSTVLLSHPALQRSVSSSPGAISTSLSTILRPSLATVRAAMLGSTAHASQPQSAGRSIVSS